MNESSFFAKPATPVLRSRADPARVRQGCLGPCAALIRTLLAIDQRTRRSVGPAVGPHVTPEVASGPRRSCSHQGFCPRHVPAVVPESPPPYPSVFWFSTNAPHSVRSRQEPMCPLDQHPVHAACPSIWPVHSVTQITFASLLSPFTPPSRHSSVIPNTRNVPGFTQSASNT
jgi:hypothetical protein